jgi:hypothetical protein
MRYAITFVLSVVGLAIWSIGLSYESQIASLLGGALIVTGFLIAGTEWPNASAHRRR